MNEYKKNDNLAVRSYCSKNNGFTAIKIEVFGVPFMCGWRDDECIPTTDSMIDAVINHFGSLSAEVYTEIVIAYKHAIDKIK